MKQYLINFHGDFTPNSRQFDLNDLVRLENKIEKMKKESGEKLKKLGSRLGGVTRAKNILATKTETNKK